METKPFFSFIQNTEIRNQSFNSTIILPCEHKGPIFNFSIDLVEQQYLLTGSADCMVSCIDLDSNKLMFKIHAHKYIVSAVEWFAHDTGMFYTASFDKFLKIWDTNKTKVSQKFPMFYKIYSISSSPIATKHCLIANGTDHTEIFLCDLYSGSSVQRLKGHKSAIKAVKWSPVNEYLLASGSKDQSIRLWDIRTLKCLTQISNSHFGTITNLQFSKDGRYLYSSANDNKLKKWDLLKEVKDTLVTYPNIENSYQISNQFTLSNTDDILFHPNGKNISLYDTDSGEELGKLTNHFSRVNACIYHPNNKNELYSGGEDYQILKWEYKNLNQNTNFTNGFFKKVEDKDDWSD
eukprot:gene1674-443_t